MNLQLAKGIAWTVKNGERISVENVDVSEFDSCCKIDCCDSILLMKDKATGVLRVGYFFNGVWTVTTHAQFLIDKANNVFNF